MAQVHDGRYTAAVEGDVVVFVIGMRINKLWKVHRWIPVALAMGPMIAELMRHPDKGLRSTRTMVGWRTIDLIQYWQSFEHLERFARNSDDPHLQAWRRYNQRIGSSGDVGVYHETYRVSPGSHEAVYANMPEIGLAAAFGHVPVGRRTDTAQQRISGDAAAAGTFGEPGGSLN
ncbi:MAG: DUF4188 domain-containing protein [Ilumatobacteraceae bacterium]